MSQHVVIYKSDLPGKEIQIVSDPLNLEDTSDLAIELNNDAASEGDEPNYIVQPVL